MRLLRTETYGLRKCYRPLVRLLCMEYEQAKKVLWAAYEAAMNGILMG